MLAFESRRAAEISELIRINGGVPFVAPALVEVPLEENTKAFAFADRLYAGQFDMIILLTGVGTRYLAQVLASRDGEERFPQALRGLTVVARGPKPNAVLREIDCGAASKFGVAFKGSMRLEVFDTFKGETNFWCVIHHAIMSGTLKLK